MVDWSLAGTEAGRALTQFVARLIAAAQAIIRCCASTQFLDGDSELAPGLNDIDWFDEHGKR